MMPQAQVLAEKKSEKSRAASPSVTTTPRSTQAERSERTRAALLSAAEKVFARDGFEAARLEDIAAEAGRTRGAFYANFSSKSDVFLALRAMARLRTVREIGERVAGVTGKAAQRKAVLQYLMEGLCDTPALLLEIEFKLFALRHPKELAELASKHLNITSTVGRAELREIFPDKDMSECQEHEITLSVEALLEGFALNAIFDPKALTREYLLEMLPRLLDIVVPQH
jgi:AcrR family transcriptional regulator